MADLRRQRGLIGNDDRTALYVVVYESSPDSNTIVHIIEPVGDAGGDLNPREPIGEDGEIRVSGVPQAIAQIGAVNETVDKVDVVTTYGSTV